MWLFLVILSIWLIIALKESSNETIHATEKNTPESAPVRFSFFTFFTQRNILRAYIYVGLELMRKDRGDLRNQQSLFLTLLCRKFTLLDRRQITKIYLNIMRYRSHVDLESVYAWFNKHSNTNEKEGFVHLLCDMAFHNNQVTTNEFKFIYISAEKIGLNIEQARSIIAVRQERLDAAFKDTRRRTELSSDIKRKQKTHVLGLSGKPSLEEVKKAYRGLAKKHHPDRFHNQSDFEKEQAHERFLIIKTAYEYLLRYK